MTAYHWLPRLLHFTDSASPVGGYAHSFGLEGVCQMGLVHDAVTLSQFLKRDVAHALRTIDLPLLAHGHQAAMDSAQEALDRLDHLSWALRPTHQLREAASKIGRQQWRLYQKTWNPAVQITFVHYQSPIVLAVICAHEGIPLEPALHAITYQTYAALLQAALKLLPVGPTATQQILTESLDALVPHLDEAARLPEAAIGSFNPVWDIGAARHETAPARLFIS